MASNERISANSFARGQEGKLWQRCQRWVQAENAQTLIAKACRSASLKIILVAAVLGWIVPSRAALAQPPQPIQLQAPAGGLLSDPPGTAAPAVLPAQQPDPAQQPATLADMIEAQGPAESNRSPSADAAFAWRESTAIMMSIDDITEQTSTALSTNAPELESLALADVLASLYRYYPEVLAAEQMQSQTAGQLRSAWGSYDTKVYAESMNQPTGYYQTYRNGLGVARQTWWGGYLSAGYRVGRGYYEPWYKERQTDDAGEFKASMTVPLLQGRAIDMERLAVFQATVDRQMVEPVIRQAILDASLNAVNHYWSWVAAGTVLNTQRNLLKLTEARRKQFEAGVKAGAFKEIDMVLNDQLIAERKTTVLKAIQKYREAGFKLSLYLRDESGNPMVPADHWLPKGYPEIDMLDGFVLQTALSEALARRPELDLIMLDQRRVSLDQRQARNEMLPNLDFFTQGSQDLGARASSSNDKGDFEFILGIRSDVPIQRRKASGKIMSNQAKAAQIQQKLRLARDKVAMELSNSYNSLRLSQMIVVQSENAFYNALETQKRYRIGFEEGYSDLVYLNLIETKANETEIKLIEAQRDWYQILSKLQRALGLDPLEQAMRLDSLPMHPMIKPSEETEEADADGD